MPNRLKHIAVIEPDAEHLKEIVDSLRENFKTLVSGFRDIKKFLEADSGDFLFFPPDLIIMEVILAYEVEESVLYPPRWDGTGSVPEDKRHLYIDNELGLEFAVKSIRGGDLTCVFRDTPIVFFTDRQNNIIKETIASMANATMIMKPKMSDKLVERISDFMKSVESPA